MNIVEYYKGNEVSWAWLIPGEPMLAARDHYFSLIGHKLSI